MSASLNALKDGYLMAAGWIEAHPHRTLWLALAVITAALVL